MGSLCLLCCLNLFRDEESYVKRKGVRFKLFCRPWRKHPKLLGLTVKWISTSVHSTDYKYFLKNLPAKH
jgi:hypothetical protein